MGEVMKAATMIGGGAIVGAVIVAWLVRMSVRRSIGRGLNW